jgi:hypothetical protein
MGLREYNPGLNRFLTRDMFNGALQDLSLGTDPWNTNRYMFGGGNPISRIELNSHINDVEDAGGDLSSFSLSPHRTRSTTSKLWRTGRSSVRERYKVSSRWARACLSASSR